MTAEEIRKIMRFEPRLKWWQRFGLTGRMQAFCLMEIAAQLAEIKELLNGKAVERIVSALEGIERR